MSTLGARAHSAWHYVGMVGDAPVQMHLVLDSATAAGWYYDEHTGLPQTMTGTLSPHGDIRLRAAAERSPVPRG